jgi:hypothetical protein
MADPGALKNCVVTLDLANPQRRIHILFGNVKAPDDGHVSFEYQDLWNILRASPEPKQFENLCRQMEEDEIDFD